MRRRNVIPYAVALVLSVACAVGAMACRDAIVIYRGIRTYDSLVAAACFAAAASAACLASRIVRNARAARYAPPPARREIPDVPDPDRMDESVRGALYLDLLEFSRGKWKTMRELAEIKAQLDSVNAYQEELSRLLAQDRYLGDRPAEIVQKIEDCMYHNVRKLVNYMRILQHRNGETVAAKIHACAEANAGLLKKTDDFIVALADYVNGDIAAGQEAKARKTVDEYMFVALQAVELPGATLE